MNKLIKKILLGSSIVAVFFFSPYFKKSIDVLALKNSFNYKKNLDTKKSIRKYKIIISSDFFLEGIKVHEKKYDLDGDGFFELGELYRYEKFSNSKYIIKEHPLIYRIDINENKIFESSEILIDGKEDGLNGNETRINEFDKDARKYFI